MIKNFKIVDNRPYYNGGGTVVEVYTVYLPHDNRMLYVNIGDEQITVTTINCFQIAAVHDFNPSDYDEFTILEINLDYIRQYEGHSYFEIACSCYLRYLECIKKKKVVIEYDAAYSPTHGVTFILKTAMVDGKLTTQEVVSFYYGEPDDECTRYYGPLCDTLVFYGDDFND